MAKMQNTYSRTMGGQLVIDNVNGSELPHMASSAELRAARGTYMPHVGAKQADKIAKRKAAKT